MNLMQRVVQLLRERSRKPNPRKRSAPSRYQPAVEALESRCVPSTAGSSAIASNFNGTAIPPGDTLWFSAAFKISGVSSSPVTFDFTNDTISYTLKNGTTTTVNAPNAEITLDPSVTTATTTFDATTNTWETSLPMKFSGNAFLAAAAVPMPNGLPGGANPVIWQGQFTSNTSAVTVNWQWAAAVYTNFSTDYNALNVKPVDDNHVSAYQNSDHAGTPEAFKPYVIGGARGGGGSNFTGSMSATASVSPQTQQGITTISGTVTDQNGAVVGASVYLIDSNGNVVTPINGYLPTDSNGNYSITVANLPPGTYSLRVIATASDFPVSDTPGTVNGNPDGMSNPPQPPSAPQTDTISGIMLMPGNTGINYDFFMHGS